MCENTFATLIEKGISPNTFRQRVATASEGILQNIPAVKDYYASNFEINLKLLITSYLFPRFLNYVGWPPWAK